MLKGMTTPSPQMSKNLERFAPDGLTTLLENFLQDPDGVIIINPHRARTYFAGNLHDHGCNFKFHKRRKEVKSCLPARKDLEYLK